jgi:hypothetical protein
MPGGAARGAVPGCESGGARKLTATRGTDIP